MCDSPYSLFIIGQEEQLRREQKIKRLEVLILIITFAFFLITVLLTLEILPSSELCKYLCLILAIVSLVSIGAYITLQIKNSQFIKKFP